MKALLFLSALLGSAPAFGQGPARLICEARDKYGLHSTFSVDIAKKRYVLTDKNGKVTPLFDSETICGWKPSAGMRDITCPLQETTGPDTYFAVSLECDRSSPTGPRPITTGSLSVQSGYGQLVCYVYAQPQNSLDLANCRFE